MRHFVWEIPDVSRAIPQVSPSGRAGYPRPSPSRLWPANTTKGISPSGISRHFPKCSPSGRGISQTVPEPPMARQHYDRHFPERDFPAFPRVFPERARGISQTVPEPPMARQLYERHFPEWDYPAFPRVLPERARGISQTVPKPPMARQHYDRHFPERDFPAFPQLRKLIPTHCIPIVSWMHKLRYPRGQAGPTTPLLWPYMVENVTDDQQGVLLLTYTSTHIHTHTHSQTHKHTYTRALKRAQMPLPHPVAATTGRSLNSSWHFCLRHDCR